MRHSPLAFPASLLSLMLPLSLPLIWIGCAEGGEENRPVSEVQVEASHHLWALIGRAAFSGFPVLSAEMTSDRGVFIMRTDSTYLVCRNGTMSGADDYALAQSGAFGVLIDQGARRPKIRFSGGYGLEGATDVYYFTDRFTNSASINVGLFWGTKIDAAVPDIEGDWHVFSQHLIYATSNVLDPNNVARSFGGRLAVDSAGAITGSGLESTKATITLTGSSQSFADGRVDFDLTFADPQTSDQRVFHTGVGTNIILGLDEDETDGESGLIALVKERTTTADPSKLAGDYFIGLHTAFVSASTPGTDAADGVLTFNSTGGFTLSATGANGEEFSYSGTYALMDDGELKFTVAGTNESWMGAVDEDYKTLIIADNFIETRTGAKPPELNLILGIREAPPPP